MTISPIFVSSCGFASPATAERATLLLAKEELARYMAGTEYLFGARRDEEILWMLDGKDHAYWFTGPRCNRTTTTASRLKLQTLSRLPVSPAECKHLHLHLRPAICTLRKQEMEHQIPNHKPRSAVVAGPHIIYTQSKSYLITTSSTHTAPPSDLTTCTLCVPLHQLEYSACSIH